ncbi:hypothetical protein WME97_18405 [Sorangium sp. So ce367]|uniref:hypothetical protein n=1 Tax=Sorangium sp. So ce367 TaxID=3133305 RepID=UPI003F63CA8E
MVKDNFGRLGASVWEHVATRIAVIADGYAHFVHLIGLHLAMRMLDANLLEAKTDLLNDAIHDAVEDAAPWLRSSYERATQKYKNRYEPILWSLAHHWELVRSTEQLFPVYMRICEMLQLDPLSRKDFSLSLNKLKDETHGRAVLSNRRSWFRLRQTMLRGYCRMIAESKGIKIGLQYLQSDDSLLRPDPAQQVAAADAASRRS